MPFIFIKSSFNQETVEKEGGGRYLWSHPMMHARGLGDDGPALMGDRDVDKFAKQELQPGMVFILKPRVRAASGKGQAGIGDLVVVKKNGGCRLGKRGMELFTD